MHDKKLMLGKVLTPLGLHYPQAGHSPKTLSLLAEDWCEDLADFDLDVLELAVKLARRKELFFPVTAKMLAYCALAARLIEDEKASRRPALPEETRMTEQEKLSARQRREQVAALLLRMRRKDPADTALAADWLKFAAPYAG